MNTQPYIYGISKKTFSKGQIIDSDVILQSIENIISTLFGERIFNLQFGCGVMLRVFEIISNKDGEQILNDISTAIKNWDDRVTVIESDMKLKIDKPNNTIFLSIPYIINKTKLKVVFNKKIIF